MALIAPFRHGSSTQRSCDRSNVRGTHAFVARRVQRLPAGPEVLGRNSLTLDTTPSIDASGVQPHLERRGVRRVGIELPRSRTVRPSRKTTLPVGGPALVALGRTVAVNSSRFHFRPGGERVAVSLWRRPRMLRCRSRGPVASAPALIDGSATHGALGAYRVDCRAAAPQGHRLGRSAVVGHGCHPRVRLHGVLGEAAAVAVLQVEAAVAYLINAIAAPVLGNNRCLERQGRPMHDPPAGRPGTDGAISGDCRGADRPRAPGCVHDRAALVGIPGRRRCGVCSR